jgi:hypothetical protein
MREPAEADLNVAVMMSVIEKILPTPGEWTPFFDAIRKQSMHLRSRVASSMNQPGPAFAVDAGRWLKHRMGLC